VFLAWDSRRLAIGIRADVQFEMLSAASRELGELAQSLSELGTNKGSREPHAGRQIQLPPVNLCVRSVRATATFGPLFLDGALTQSNVRHPR
jgi:hypothetical protein